MIKSTKRGFTLIELLVVIAIIGMLSSVVVASMNSARMKSRDARRISDISNLKVALELFFDANQSYPTTTTGWALLAPSYIPKIPNDPKSNAAYSYAATQCVNAGTATAKCASYHIGATLEDTANAALNGDNDDAVRTDLNTGAGAYADFAGTDPIFDTTP